MNAVTSLERTFTIEEFSPVCKGSLRGFAKVVMPSGMILSDVSIHVDAGRAWAMPASKAMLDRNGLVIKDPSGKIRYAPIITFSTKHLRDRFSNAVIEAIRISYPESLA